MVEILSSQSGVASPREPYATRDPFRRRESSIQALSRGRSAGCLLLSGLMHVPFAMPTCWRTSVCVETSLRTLRDTRSSAKVVHAHSVSTEFMSPWVRSDQRQLSRICSARPSSTSIMWRRPVIAAASGVSAARSSRDMCSRENFRQPAISWRRPWASRS